MYDIQMMRPAWARTQHAITFQLVATSSAYVPGVAENAANVVGLSVASVQGGIAGAAGNRPSLAYDICLY
ncbi:hypothetical protein HU200_015695 [Digitaria exilis]|uniref:Uncharacterized protein n=1 Tax=Digitaria exilis TaxID=1010633 RepID=A0A835F8U4_9POAL|nr:hypothetical protein HU200_015695 [Digitaria exilis]